MRSTYGTMTRLQKFFYVEKVIKSCITYEQLLTVESWLDRIDIHDFELSIELSKAIKERQEELMSKGAILQ